MRKLRTVAVVLLLGLLATACGARLDPTLRKQAADSYLYGGGGTGPGGSQATGPGGNQATGPGGNQATGPGGNQATGPGGNQATGPGTTGTGPGQQTTGPGKQGTGPGTQPAGCASKGTDVGLTTNSVTVGLVASTTGPVSGLFQGAIQGEQSFANYVNNQGGLCGHTMRVNSADDGTQCAQDENVTDDLVKKVFAMVGTFTLFDGCGAKVIKAHPDVSDFHVWLDPAAGVLANHFDIEPGHPGYATGMFAYYAQKLGDKVKSVGTLYPNIASAVAKQAAIVNSAKSQGWNIVYSRAVDATENDWTTDFAKMCGPQYNIKIFFTPAENAKYAATMIRDEGNAGCTGVTNIIPVAYDQAFVADVGDNSKLEGLLGYNEYSLFFNPDEAAKIPELKLLQDWFANTYPGQPLNLYALFAWAEGRLFQQAFEHAGTTMSRAALQAAANKIHSFDAGGIIAPSDPTSKGDGVHCYILWQFHNGKFIRVDDPATGYRCDGKYLQYNGG